MTNKLFSCIHLAFASLLLSGCATSMLTKLDGVSPSEAITVGRFHIFYNDKDITKDCQVAFNLSPGHSKYVYNLDETGYIFVKLPTGGNSLSYIGQKSGFMNYFFKEGELTCNSLGGGTINYIGDITMNWHGADSGAATALIATTGGIGRALTRGGCVVKVQSNVVGAKETFNQKFSTNRDITPELLVVKQPQ